MPAHSRERIRQTALPAPRARSGVREAAAGKKISLRVFEDGALGAALDEAPTAADLHHALATHYAATNTPEQWVQVLPATDDGKLAADTLAGTNQLELRVFGNETYRQAVLIARLDNLGKGASGAAVQNLKLMLGI